MSLRAVINPTAEDAYRRHAFKDNPSRDAVRAAWDRVSDHAEDLV